MPQECYNRAMDPLTTMAVTKATEAATDVAKEEGKTLLKQLLGPSAEAIGDGWGIKHRERLFNNVVEAAARAKRKLADAGLSAKVVPLKIIHPLLEGASLEEDPDMREKWANLLANAADPRQEVFVSPAFPNILKELTSREVKFLDALHRDVLERTTHIRGYTLDYMKDLYTKAGLSRLKRLTYLTIADTKRYGTDLKQDLRDFQCVYVAIERHGLITEHVHAVDLEDTQFSKPMLEKAYELTDFGIAFIMACQPPKVP